jgi:hypothetical protein
MNDRPSNPLHNEIDQPPTYSMLAFAAAWVEFAGGQLELREVDWLNFHLALKLQGIARGY